MSERPPGLEAMILESHSNSSEELSTNLWRDVHAARMENGTLSPQSVDYFQQVTKKLVADGAGGNYFKLENISIQNDGNIELTKSFPDKTQITMRPSDAEHNYLTGIKRPDGSSTECVYFDDGTHDEHGALGIKRVVFKDKDQQPYLIYKRDSINDVFQVEKGTDPVGKAPYKILASTDGGRVYCHYKGTYGDDETMFLSDGANVTERIDPKTHAKLVHLNGELTQVNYPVNGKVSRNPFADHVDIDRMHGEMTRIIDRNKQIDLEKRADGWHDQAGNPITKPVVSNEDGSIAWVQGSNKFVLTADGNLAHTQIKPGDPIPTPTSRPLKPGDIIPTPTPHPLPDSRQIKPVPSPLPTPEVHERGATPARSTPKATPSLFDRFFDDPK